MEAWAWIFMPVSTFSMLGHENPVPIFPKTKNQRQPIKVTAGLYILLQNINYQIYFCADENIRPTIAGPMIHSIHIVYRWIWT